MDEAAPTGTDADAAKLEAFERRMVAPITVSAILPIVFSLAGRDSIVSRTILVVTWFVFVADLVVHVRLSPRYLRSPRGAFDLVVVILTAPWFLIPGLGDARFLSLARLARLARILKAGGKGLTRLAAQLGRVGAFTAGLVVACAYVAFSQERAVNDGFGDFGDALWWATVTITTVGYGDIFPVTTIGRLVAVVLMFAGLGVLGVLAGVLASFFGVSDDSVEARDAARDAAAGPSTSPGEEDLGSTVAALRAQVADLDRALAALLEARPGTVVAAGVEREE